ncbi:MAG: tetratricopeptide repeat protein [Cyanobacteria bacterium J06638_20]
MIQRATHSKPPSRTLQRWVRVMAIALPLISCLMTSPVLAQEEDEEDEFEPNPLELTEPDPLLPEPVVERPLSPLERYELRLALNRLNREAQIAFAAGQTNRAFDIWNRELRLRRVLGYEEEVPALARVGTFAWEENVPRQVRIITERLLVIEQDLQQQQPLDFGMLLTIADSYQVMRAYDPAVRLYGQILEQARLEGDLATEESTMISLADLHLGWFAYPEAAEIYEELLRRARQRGDQFQEEEYLNLLGYAYQQGDQHEEAVGILLQLVEWYRELDPIRIPMLRIDLGNSYKELGQNARAATSYQEAYVTALSQEQYGYATDALTQLANLYMALDRPDDALVVYQLRITVEAEAYDRLGTMETLASIGEIYRDRGDTQRSIIHFRQALVLAQELGYPARITYFTEQIIAQQQGRSDSAGEEAQAEQSLLEILTPTPQQGKFSQLLYGAPTEEEFSP